MLLFSKKIKFFTLLLLTTTTVCFAPDNANAGGDISLGLGHFDVLDNEDSLDIRVEYRFDNETFLGIKPFIGMQTSTDKAIHGLIGLYRDFQLSDNFSFTPSLGGGPYANGHGPDLDHYIQFRSMLELGYKLNEDYKVSLGLSHTSNANLSDSNPGTESAVIYIHRGWP